MKDTKIPSRKEIKNEDKWDLSPLYSCDTDWDKDLEKLKNYSKDIQEYRKKLEANNVSVKDLKECLDVYSKAEQVGEKLGSYAFLNKSTDESCPKNLDRYGRFMMAATTFEAETSWLIPTIQSLPNTLLESNDSSLKDYRVWLDKLIRLKPFILSEKEERILALQMEANQTAYASFSVLTNVDLDFGTVKTKEGEKPLSQSTWSVFLESPDREIRKQAYEKFYSKFDSHKNTIATMYTGSVNLDVAHARIRGYTSSRVNALFPDKVDETVYDNLVLTIRENLAPLHKYYSLRKKVLELDELRHYDVYVPLVNEVKKITPYNEAVELVAGAVQPLGEEYVKTLKEGLLGGWVDRYENKGKRSGAFSSGGYVGYPYILMNYKEEVLRDVFTLAHEAGHSMHSYYSAKNNPFMSYNYTIFEAEVASTVNEDLLFKYLMEKADSKEMRAYLLAMRAQDIVATLYRQTMFAEFEDKTHKLVESGTPLTCDLIRKEYKELLEAYFGPEMVFEETSDLEALRIPHFYRAFYVYKYATGISAALALANGIINGGKAEKDAYFEFLKSGGSRYPIEALKVAGVNMASSEPIQAACDEFSKIVDELTKILL